MRTIEEVKKELEEAIEIATPYNEKISLLKDEIENIQIENMKLNIGKCFKYRNSYSCPQSEEDYWFVYHQIVDVKNGRYNAIMFQTTSDGTCSISQEELFYRKFSSCFTEITEKEFNQAKERFLQTLNNTF